MGRLEATSVIGFSGADLPAEGQLYDSYILGAKVPYACEVGWRRRRKAWPWSKVAAEVGVELEVAQAFEIWRYLAGY